MKAGGVRILQDVDLLLHPGEMCALIGPSGAGKSTLIKVLLGLRDADEGRVRIGGGGPEVAGPLGYVPQDDALHRTLTVARELECAAALRLPGATAEARARRVTEVLGQVGLSERRDVRIRRLSGGQRKRVSVALELLTRPPVLVLDEPTSGLDPALEARTMELLSTVARSGRIVLVATHATQSLEKADALCVLHRGRVAFFGPPALALEYFRVERYAGLFHQLEKQEPAAWSIGARADADQKAFLRRPAPEVEESAGRGAGTGAAGTGTAVTGAASDTPAPSSVAEQSRVLASRYGSTLLGDAGSLLLLLAQAPLIGWLCAVVWGSVERDTPALWFVLCLAAVWFGCINACREIVKERAVFERERLFGVRPLAYVLSKARVLALVGAAQVILLQGTVEWSLQLRGPMGLEMLALFGASLAGTGLGLLVSAVASTQERAVFAVPLLLLPQILFSELAIPSDLYSDVVAVAEKAMPVHWAFRVFEEGAALEPRWLLAALALIILVAMSVALLGAAALALLPRREA